MSVRKSCWETTLARNTYTPNELPVHLSRLSVGPSIFAPHGRNIPLSENLANSGTCLSSVNLCGEQPCAPLPGPRIGRFYGLFSILGYSNTRLQQEISNSTDTVRRDVFGTLHRLVVFKGVYVSSFDGGWTLHDHTS